METLTIISFFISLFILYKDYLQKFNLEAYTAGRITLTRNPFSIELSQDALLLDLIFTNRGSKRGVIIDVALKLKNKDKFIIFRSLSTETDRKLNLTKELQSPSQETFIAFALNKNDSLTKRIFFVPYDIDQKNFKFIIGDYSVDLLIYTSLNSKWEKYSSVNFKVEQEDITNMQKSSYEYNPDGSIFVKNFTQDKPLSESEDRLKLLNIVSNKYN